MRRLNRLLLVLALAFAGVVPGGALAQQPDAPLPPGPSGRIISGSISPDGGFGLVVFGGGTYGQLVSASGCPGARVVFWVTRGGEFLVFVPGTAVAAVNAGFQAAFPNDSIPPNTPLLGRCLPAPESGIEGLVTLGPICPVQSALLPCPDQPYQATLVFLDGQGHEAARTTSGADRRYRVALPAGRYTVLPLAPGSQPFPRASAVDAMVVAGFVTVVHIAYDTGIRTAVPPATATAVPGTPAP